LHLAHIRTANITLVNVLGKQHILSVTNPMTLFFEWDDKAMKILKIFRRRGYTWQPALNVQSGTSAAVAMIFVGN
jgi:hypothetical protein